MSRKTWDAHLRHPRQAGHFDSWRAAQDNHVQALRACSAQLLRGARLFPKEMRGCLPWHGLCLNRREQ